MSSDRWIVIPNWRKFQHYKHRNPPWIRVYTSLLHHEPFLSLTPRHKGLLFDIWMLYASHNGQLPGSPAYIANQCGFPSEWVLRQRREAGEGHGEDTVRERDLKALEQAEFLLFVASKPLAIHGPETENRDIKNKQPVENPKPRKPPPPRESRTNWLPTDPAKAIERMITNGVIQHPIDLESEIIGAGLDADTADELRKLAYVMTVNPKEAP